MNKTDYLKGLLKKYTRYFDIESNVNFLGEGIDIYAKHCNISGRTFITKSDVIDRYENYEYCYVKYYEELKKEDIEHFCDFLTKVVENIVNPDASHMSTYITGVIFTNKASDNYRNVVEKFKYSRTYMFYLKGWSEVRLVYVNLRNGDVITNIAGEKVKKVYQITP